MYIKSHYCSVIRINQVKGCDDVIMTSFTLGLEIHSYLGTKAVQYRSKRSSGRCYHLTHLLQDKYLSILVSRLHKTKSNLRTPLFHVQNTRNKRFSPNVFLLISTYIFLTPQQPICTFPHTHLPFHFLIDLNPENPKRKSLCYTDLF